MKNENNLTTIVAFEVANREVAPVKAAISEEVDHIISEVYQLDDGLGFRLQYIFGVMLRNFHEDIRPVCGKDLSPIDYDLAGLSSRVEKAKLLLHKEGYRCESEADNPMWFLDLLLKDIKHIKKLIRKGEAHERA